jgi:hypothetical protein
MEAAGLQGRALLRVVDELKALLAAGETERVNDFETAGV